MSFSGYDIEDAIVLNKASLDRGFGRCVVRKTIRTSINTYQNRTEERIVPPAFSNKSEKHTIESGYSRTSSTGHFRLLDDDGLIGPGEILQSGDICVNKEAPKNTKDRVVPHTTTSPDGSYRSAPTSWKGNQIDQYVVDRVLLSANLSDNFFVKVLVRHMRKPEVGDKFSSRHGQ